MSEQNPGERRSAAGRKQRGHRTFTIAGERFEVFAVWSGGPYVDLSWDRENEHAFEVVNIWDYAKGEAAARYTTEMQGDPRNIAQRALDEWSSNLGRGKPRAAQLTAYVRNTHPDYIGRR